MAYSVLSKSLKPKLPESSLGVIERVKFEWESAVDSVPQLICVLRKDGTVLRSNRTMEQWGLGSVGEVSGRSMHDLLHPGCDSHNCYFKKILGLSGKILATGGGVEYRVYDEVLGRNIHIQFNPVGVDDKDANSYLVIIIRDISKLDLSSGDGAQPTRWSLREPSIPIEASLQQMPDVGPHDLHGLTYQNADFKFIEKVKREWESAVDSLPQVICLVNEHGVIVRANRAIEQWKLGDVTSAKGRSLHDMLHAGCADDDCYLHELNALIREVHATGQVAERQGYDADLKRHLHFQINVFSALQGSKDGLVVVLISDISDIKRAELKIESLNSRLEKKIETRNHNLQKINQKLKQEIEVRKRVEHELRSSRQEYHLLVETMNEGMVVQDVDRKIIYVNRRLLKMLGYARDRVLGRHFNEFIDQDYLDGWSGEKLESIKGLETAYVVRIKGKGSKSSWVKVSPQPLFNADKEYTGSFAVITDINDHIEIEQKLMRTESQLRSLSKQVLRAQEVERKRIASELHDGIGQTLSAIKFYVENNISTLPPLYAPVAEKIEMVVPKLQAAIEEVRRISMDLRPSLLDDIGILATLSWLCRESKQLYPHIDFVFDVSGVQESDILPALKTEMFRIVQEAVNNACKYSKAKKILISLRLDGPHFRLEIRDDGQGFNYQAIAGMQGYSESKGLGLASMRERAENAGGWFSIASSSGSGTSVVCLWSTDNRPVLIRDRRKSEPDRRARERS